MSLLGMLRGLNEARVRFVVIGGVAGTVHGSTHVTNDLDVCYDPAPDNLAALASLLSSWGAYPRGVPDGLPFVMDVRTLRGAPILTLRTTEGEIDLFDRVEGVGTYAECSAGAEWVDVPPVRFLALGLEALIRAKRAAGRPKDLLHLRELEALRELKDRS